MMEDLDRIERKLQKLWGWCEFLLQESKENHEHYLFQEDYDLVVSQNYFNLTDIDELRIDYAHGHFSAVEKTERGFQFRGKVLERLMPPLQRPIQTHESSETTPETSPMNFFFSFNICFHSQYG